MTYTINKDQCTYCGLCATECPSSVITIEKSEQTAIINHSNCIECSHCGMVCPVNAVQVDGEKLPDYPENIKDFDHIINSKRSIRHYKPGTIDNIDLEDILHSGRTTATASNSQQVKAIVLQGEQVRNASLLISKVLLKVVRLGLNPVVRQMLKLLGLNSFARKSLLEDYNTRINDTIAGNADIFFFNSPEVVILTYPVKGKRFGRTDCALAGQNMMLTAHARGIGSCMIGFAEAALMTKGLRKKVGVDAGRRIGLIFTLGYTKNRYYRYPKRAE